MKRKIQPIAQQCNRLYYENCGILVKSYLLHRTCSRHRLSTVVLVRFTFHSFGGLKKQMKMSDLAKLAGVSKSTVSRALAGSERVTKETRDRIQQLAKEHNYRMNMRARNFRLQNILTIGVLLPSNGQAEWLATDPFVLELLGSVADALEAKGGHELLLAKHSNNDPSWILEFAETRSVDGIIVIGQSLYHEELNKAADITNTMVVWGAQLPDQKYVTVGTDNYQGCKLATEHLLAQGRKRFVFLGDTRFPETQLRYQGFQAALADAGLTVHSELTAYSETASDAALNYVSEILDRQPGFDALVASSDMLAFSAIKAIHNGGLTVPGDIAVAGYDDITLSEYSNPTLTSVTQNRRAGGKALVDTLFDLLDNKPAQSLFIPTELVTRESTLGR